MAANTLLGLVASKQQLPLDQNSFCSNGSITLIATERPSERAIYYPSARYITLIILFIHVYSLRTMKPLSHKSYRPLTVLTFWLNHRVHGLEPFGYHLVNVVLHTLVTLLFYR